MNKLILLFLSLPSMAFAANDLVLSSGQKTTIGGVTVACGEEKPAPLFVNIGNYCNCKRGSYELKSDGRWVSGFGLALFSYSESLHTWKSIAASPSFDHPGFTPNADQFERTCNQLAYSDLMQTACRFGFDKAHLEK